jgi:hypothetical protein
MTAKNILEEILRRYQYQSGGELTTKKAALPQMRTPKLRAAIRILYGLVCFRL